MPFVLPCGEDRVGILGAATAAVVAAQREEQVAFLDVQIVAQDHATHAQVGAHVEQCAGVSVADQARPERHDLHIATRAGTAHGIFLEAGFDRDEAQDQLRVETCAQCFIVHGLEKFDAASIIGLVARRQPIRHRSQPVGLFHRVSESWLRRRTIRAHCPGKHGAHRVRQRFIFLRATLCQAGHDQQSNQPELSVPSVLVSRLRFWRHAVSLDWMNCAAPATGIAVAVWSRRC